MTLFVSLFVVYIYIYIYISIDIVIHKILLSSIENVHYFSRMTVYIIPYKHKENGKVKSNKNGVIASKVKALGYTKALNARKTL